MNTLQHKILSELLQFQQEQALNISHDTLVVLAFRLATFPADPKIESQKTCLTRAACAELLGVSLPTLDRYIREEGLPHLIKNPLAKRRKHYIFIAADVLKWAQSHLSSDSQWSSK